jgi:hypothetical protein
LKTLAPTKSFGGLTLADFEAQVENSLAPRVRLRELNDQAMQQMAMRDDEDSAPMGKYCSSAPIRSKARTARFTKLAATSARITANPA